MKIDEATLNKLMEMTGECLETLDKVANILESTGQHPDILENIREIYSKSDTLSASINIQNDSIALTAGGRSITSIHFFKNFSEVSAINKIAHSIHDQAQKDSLI